MPTTKKTTTKPKAKPTTKPKKELKLEFVRMCQEKNALHKREERAREYCRQIQRRRDKRVEKICKAIETIAIVLTFVIVAAIVIKGKGNVEAETKSNVYTMQGELQGNCVVLSDGNVHEVDRAYKSCESMSVMVRLNDNGTEDVTDDIILDIR